MSLRPRRISARRTDTTEPESDYIAMTDMMVGVLFIFIIMLCFFALQYKKTTASLTGAKDAQTTALLQTANALSRETIEAEIDRQAHVVCLPGALFGDHGAGETRRCFAYTGDKPQLQPDAADRQRQIAAADRAALMSGIDNDMQGASVPVTVGIDNANLVMPANRLFAANSAALTPEGQAAMARVAQTLRTRLPCYAEGAAGSCGNAARLNGVNIQINASFDAFTAEGRAASALALQRSVAFHNALVATAPELGKLRAAPGTEPLLRVSSYQQSSTAGQNQDLVIQFVITQ
ncbi:MULTISPECIES: hypothetical protein [Asticcacaulis]|uniref:hypothetical protein n=1 Tax=Asticcacaulis TaxID=76890 RepID=UPI001AE8FB83|nr:MULTISPECIES: hypothetical protein [Asticcacaulis]MBP2160760.1 hypothetical protein [Asticcacaulis solisilvae]MDR6801805.1 hypothetical protein [Asticcacaulis sp. BE141]